MPRPRDSENLEVALRQLERIADSQMRAFEAATTKTSVVLGFVMATLGSVVALGRPAFAFQPAAASIGTASLVVSAVVLAHAFRIGVFALSPEPLGLVARLGAAPLELRHSLVTSLANALAANAAAFADRFRWVNSATALAVVGAIIYALGVGFA